MPFQPAPSIASVVIAGVMDGQLVELTSSWFASGGISEASLQALTDGVSGWFAGTVLPLLSRDVSGGTVRAVDETTATGPVAQTGFTGVGGVDQESAPNNVAACISFRTAQRGRSARGRNFVMGIPNSLITLNTLDAGFMGDIQTAYELLIGAGAFVSGWQWVVLSRVTGGVPRANGIGIPITSVSFTTNKVRSMRSREVGHGA